MPTVAEQLRRAREEQKLDVYQVAEITKIKTDHIRALEAGDYDSFSAPVYIRGFVRSYARVLKLDVASVGADLEAELGQTRKFREPPPLTNDPKGPLDFVMLQLSKLNWRIVLVIFVLGTVLILAISSLRKWSHRKKDNPLQTLPPGMYQAPQNQSGDTLPLPPAQ